MLTGNAVAWTLRGHFLVAAALNAMITTKAFNPPGARPVRPDSPTDVVPGDDENINIDVDKKMALHNPEEDIKDCLQAEIFLSIFLKPSSTLTVP